MRAISRTAMMSMTQNKTFPTLASLQYDVEHKTAAAVGQQQESKAGQRPAQGNSPAPAAYVASRQQYAESEPRQQGEDGLVVHGEQFGSKAHGYDGAGNDGKCQYAKAYPYQAKQQ